MTEHRDGHDGHDEHDEDLRALLSSADPAADLPQADPTRVARLLEDTMTRPAGPAGPTGPTDPTGPTRPDTEESRADGTHGRSRLTWLLAAAAVVLIAAVATFGLTRGDGSAPSAGDAPDPAATSGSQAPATGDGPTEPGASAGAGAAGPDSESVTRLAVSATPSGRCLPPEDNPQVLAGQEVAFDGTVEQVSRGLVTLRPTSFYAGDPTDLVVVRAPSSDVLQLLVGVEFREGERYLVSATDGQVTLCGFSAAWTPDLERLYADAFAG